jgi:hypothetical protein
MGYGMYYIASFHASSVDSNSNLDKVIVFASILPKRRRQLADGIKAYKSKLNEDSNPISLT